MRPMIRNSAQMTLVSLFSYLCGFQLTNVFHGASAGTGALWSVISGVLVLQATRHATWLSARVRVLATFVGSVVSAAYLSVWPFSAIGMAVSIFVTVLLCQVARIHDHTRPAVLTVAVIMVLASLNSTLTPIQGAALRFGESCVGTAMALFVILIWPAPRDIAEP